MRFERTRKSRSKLLSYYITSAVFSVLSLISYSIKIDIVPGRMGMLTVLYLIQINTYSSVKAPLNRGLSLIEKWFIGMQVTIIIAILEYAVLLTLRKFWSNSMEKLRLDYVDGIAFIVSACYLIIFTVTYWFF